MHQPPHYNFSNGTCENVLACTTDSMKAITVNGTKKHNPKSWPVLHCIDFSFLAHAGAYCLHGKSMLAHKLFLNY